MAEFNFTLVNNWMKVALLRQILPLKWVQFLCPHPVHNACTTSSSPQITNMEEAAHLIEDLKEKFRVQGQQVIAYRRKLRQQASPHLLLSTAIQGGLSGLAVWLSSLSTGRTAESCQC